MVAADMDMETEEEPQQQHHHVEFSSDSTTIDPSAIASRIRQSVSLQKEEEMRDVAASNEQPRFPKLSAQQANGNIVEYRRVRCPPHRYTPLREYWEQILTPLVEYLKLQVRKNMMCKHY